MKKGRILVVDDNAGIRSALKILLPMHFEAVEVISTPNLLITALGEFKPDVVLLDMNFYREINTGNEGLFWLSEIKSYDENIEVVLFTAYADISLAVEGMKRGAADFVVKPWNNDSLTEVLSDAVRLRTSVKNESVNASSMRWGESPMMTSLHNMVERVAPTDANVLITGENGVGKDILAQEIHRLSKRAGKSMLCVDMGAVTESLFESELFGHVKGAFTDAKSDHTGKFEQADGGTLFLDEIGNIPLHLQAKLLRVLQNKTIVKVGGNTPVSVNIRLICATNMDIPAMVADGRFREDLYYRINTMELSIPPLRDRKDEIMPLAQLFLEEFAKRYSRRVTGFTAQAQEVMMRNRWSGNIRELRNCIERAVILSDGKSLDVKDLMITIELSSETDGGSFDAEQVESLEEIEKKAICHALNTYKDLTQVAKSLGISRPTLYSKLKKYNL